MSVDPSTITTGSFQGIAAIDFTKMFSKNIYDLRTALSISRELPLAQGDTFHLYKFNTTLADGNVAEGATIPLSNVTRPVSTEVIKPLKYATTVSAELIQKAGEPLALGQTNQEMLRSIAGVLLTNFVKFLGSNPTKITADNFQKAVALGRAKALGINEFAGAPLVVLANPADTANFLATQQLQTTPDSTAYGVTTLGKYMGIQVIECNAVPAGKVYVTAVNNLVYAHANLSGSLQNSFNFALDDTGSIGYFAVKDVHTMTINTGYYYQGVMFAEVPEGVIEVDLTSPASSKK